MKLTFLIICDVTGILSQWQVRKQCIVVGDVDIEAIT